MDYASTVAEALAAIVSRDFRSGLYLKLTEGLHDGLDELTYPTFSALARAGEPVSAATIGPQVGLDRSVVSRRAQTLARAGLVREESDPTDRRRVLLSLTAEGLAVLDQCRRRLREAIESRLSDWPQSDREEFARHLREFAASPL